MVERELKLRGKQARYKGLKMGKKPDQQKNGIFLDCAAIFDAIVLIFAGLEESANVKNRAKFRRNRTRDVVAGEKG